MNLRLGTVQFGMDYGINGQKKPSRDEALHMLDYAVHNGIHNIDTAFAYGSAEDVVGEFLGRKTISRNELNISSKLAPNILDDVLPENYEKKILKLIKLQLKRLHTDYLDVYLYHSAHYVYNNALLNALQTVKKEGLATMVGISVYEPEEATAGLNSPYVDFIQLPYSIFDQRMLKNGVFNNKNINDTIIDARSAFIQGLIVMDEQLLPPFLYKAKPVVKKINDVCKYYNINRIALALSFVKQQKAINSIVFGVDNMEQLKEDILYFQKGIPVDIVHNIAMEFEDIDTDIVMPSLWHRN